jgi:amidohydrolase
MTGIDAKAKARARLDEFRNTLIDLSHRIHANPEPGFQEHKASAWLVETLSQAGLAVESGVCDLPTAFAGQAGSGSLHVAICAEYDALPEMGHACGHNIIATAAAGAAIALAPVADEVGITVRIIGTPAEEGGGGKILLLERGAFDGVHAAMMVHPSPVDILEPLVIAVQDFDVHYIGKEAHASSFPDRGINAADALTVAQVAIGLLRQHIGPRDRIHGIVTKGGDAVNVIPAHTSAHYAIRASRVDRLEELRTKVYRCFEAGAVATGAKLEITERGRPYAQMHADPDLSAAYRSNAEALGRNFVDPGSRAASTDMGNVSLVIPAIQPLIGINSLPARNHQPEFVAHCVTPEADKAVIDGALSMAWTAIDVALDEPARKRLLETSSRKSP